MDKILITGGKGFIGRHLCERLTELGYSFEVIDLVDCKDICTERVSGFNTVFHLAAVSSIPVSYKDPERCFQTNVWGTYNIISQLIGAKFINASSSAVYGTSPYSISKLCAENIINAFDNAINLRLFNVFGEGQEGTAVIPSFARAILSGKNPTIEGTGTQKRDFIYVKDVVEEMIYCAEHKLPSKCIDVGYNTQFSIQEISEFIIKHYSSDKTSVYTDRRKGDIDETLAKDKLHITPIGFKEGLKRTLDWYEKI